MITRMTAAWGEKVTGIFVYGFVFLVSLCVLAVSVAFVTKRTFFASLDPAFSLAANLFLLLVPVFWLYGRRVGGRVLLDCGSDSLRKLGLLAAALFLFGGLSGVVTSGGVSPSGGDIRQLALAAFLICAAFSRLQIRENGIWENGSLLRWHKIVSYGWADDGTLVLRAKSFLMVLPRNLSIPLEQGDAVTALLTEHAPQAHES